MRFMSEVLGRVQGEALSFYFGLIPFVLSLKV